MQIFICAFMATIAPIVTTLSMVFNLAFHRSVLYFGTHSDFPRSVCIETIQNITDSVYLNTCKDLEMYLFTVQEQSAQPYTATEL